VHRADNLTNLRCRLSESLKLLEPSGPVQACNGIALPLPLPLVTKALGCNYSHCVCFKDNVSLLYTCKAQYNTSCGSAGNFPAPSLLTLNAFHPLTFITNEEKLWRRIMHIGSGRSMNRKRFYPIHCLLGSGWDRTWFHLFPVARECETTAYLLLTNIRFWLQVQWYENGGKCGECGDNYALKRPRPNENGGTFGTGIIVAT
jgi:hypothetical protein